MLNSNDISDRVRGCILGGAIGDAMGGPFEGLSGPFEYTDSQPWLLSDDTQLTLATCEAITSAGDVSPERIAATMLKWFRARRITGVGASTLKALRDLDSGVHWALAGAKGERTAGNGAAMRIAPLAFFLDPKSDLDRQTLRDVSRITHHNDEAYVGALAVMTAIRLLAFRNSSPKRLLSDVIAYLPDSRVRDRIAELNTLEEHKTFAEVGCQFGSSGYVVESVPLAIYAIQTIDLSNIESVLQRTIELGGDTDTIASITGQIAGVWIGFERISREAVAKLPHVVEIDRIVNEFAETASAVTE